MKNNAYSTDRDWLGTEGVRTDLSGAVAEVCDNLPYGDSLNCSTSDITPLHFTGKTRDGETGLYDFGARYDSTAMGRFLTPESPFADQSSGDPQSWNLYAYVPNDPSMFTDFSGRACRWFPSFIYATGAFWFPPKHTSKRVNV